MTSFLHYVDQFWSWADSRTKKAIESNRVLDLMTSFVHYVDQFWSWVDC